MKSVNLQNKWLSQIDTEKFHTEINVLKSWMRVNNNVLCGHDTILTIPIGAIITC